MSASGNPPPSGPTGASGSIGPIPPVGPTGPANVNQVIAAVATRVKPVSATISDAVKKQEADDRSWIARWIINTFVGAVSVVLLLLLVRGIVTGDWDTVTAQAADVLKSTVLPIVTLVLGYYFGQSSKTS